MPLILIEESQLLEIRKDLSSLIEHLSDIETGSKVDNIRAKLDKIIDFSITVDTFRNNANCNTKIG